MNKRIEKKVKKTLEINKIEASKNEIVRITNIIELIKKTRDSSFKQFFFLTPNKTGKKLCIQYMINDYIHKC